MENPREKAEQALADLVARQNLRTRLELRHKVLFFSLPSKGQANQLADLAGIWGYDQIDRWMTMAAQEEVHTQRVVKYVKMQAQRSIQSND